MSLLNLIRSSGLFRHCLAFLTFVSLVCTQVPLFNYLGFEFSALIALLAGYGAGLLVFSFSREQELNGRPYPLYRYSAAAALLLLVSPLVVISLNALVVKNCSFAGGAVFYVLGPTPAVLFGASLGVLIVSLTSRWRKTLFSILYVAILAQILVVTLTTPRIFAFNPLLGFFPGITYDETIAVESRLILYRIVTLVMAAVMVLLSGALSAFRKGNRSASRARPIELLSLGAGFAILAAAFFYSDEWGFSSSEESIQRELNGMYSTDHFIIIYPAEMLSKERVRAIALRHEFYFSLIAKELRAAPSRKIRSFIYGSAEQKGKLIGASGTNIAKPWLWQIHVNMGDIDRVLKHELVHVMAADFGFPLLRIGLNPGLIEGLATAVERVEYDETVHRLAAQIFAIGLEPDVGGLFGVSGFLKSHGGTSYVLAGSFCRFLIDQYGTRRFKWLYRTGSFSTFYNKELPALIAEWRRFIEGPKPSAQEKMRAAYLFHRPSIFGKECARVISGINEETRSFLGNKRFDEAVESSRRSLDLSRTPEAILQYATALRRAGRPEEVLAFGLEALNDSSIAHSLLPLHLILGDAYWSLGNRQEANRMYEALYGIHLSPAYDEACGIRLASLRDAGEAKLREFVLGDIDDSLRTGWLKKRLSPKPGSFLIPYLLGRELMNSGQTKEAMEVLLRLGPVRVGVLEFLRLRRMGRMSFDLGNYEEAKVYFWESLNHTTKESHGLETREWISRCDWTEKAVKGKQ